MQIIPCRQKKSGDEMGVYLHSCLITACDVGEQSDLHPGLFNQVLALGTL